MSEKDYETGGKDDNTPEQRKTFGLTRRWGQANRAKGSEKKGECRPRVTSGENAVTKVKQRFLNL